MSEELLFAPLGGAGEIGMNLYLYGYGKPGETEWIMVDCGITFADGPTAGVDVLTPDPEFIAAEAAEGRLKGLLLTHAHEDHVGAIPHLWDQLQCPVWATTFGANFLRRKLIDEGVKSKVPVLEISPGERFDVGPFNVEFIPVTHSIPEACSVVLRSPKGTVLHTGDFKFDPDPVVGWTTDFDRFKAVGDEGVLAMTCDSTNIFSEGVGGSEGALFDSMVETIGACKQRVIVSCFASNLARVLTIAKAAEACGRSVVLVGRSLDRITQVARDSGYLKDAPPMLRERDAAHLPPENTLIISTGCQGEPRAALWRIAIETHPRIRLDKGDTVIFSSKIIPGNEISIAHLHNELIRRGIEVITERDAPIHVSGHPARGEVTKMYEMVRPRIAIPMHGETIHLQEHRRLAKALEVPETPLVENGSVLRLAGAEEGASPEIIDAVPIGELAVEGNRLVPLNGELIRGRKRALWNGTATITVVLDKEGNTMADPQISTSGLVDLHEGHIEEGALDAAEDALDDLSSKALRDDDALGEAVRVGVRRYFRKTLDKSPIVTVHLVRI